MWTDDMLNTRLKVLVGEYLESADPDSRRETFHACASITSSLLTYATMIVIKTVDPRHYEEWLRDTTIALRNALREAAQEKIRERSR